MSNTLIERKLRMPQIQGVKGEVVVVYCELWHALVYTSAGDGVSAVRKNSRFP